MMGDTLGADQALTPLATLRSAVVAQDARTAMPERFAAEALEGTPEARTDIRLLDHIEGAPSAALRRSADAARRQLA